jgi:hypothetical protein
MPNGPESLQKFGAVWRSLGGYGASLAMAAVAAMLGFPAGVFAG